MDGDAAAARYRVAVGSLKSAKVGAARVIFARLAGALAPWLRPNLYGWDERLVLRVAER